VLLFLINPPEDLEGADLAIAWKFVFAYSVSLAVFLLAGRKECRGRWRIALAVLMGLISMALGSRNIGGECLAAAFFLFVVHVARRKNPGVSRLKAGTIVALAASILLSIAGVMWAYGRAASAGILGQDAQEKYLQESSGKYGVLLGGRTEILASFPAVYDSPILGHGSWAKDPIYIIQQHQALLLLGYKYAAMLITPAALRDGLIPAHSYLFQAWVDAGILGAVFWGWIFILAARVLLRVYPENNELLPVGAFLVFLLLWNIPFSPYGTDGRLTFPYTFVLLMTLMDTVSGKAVRAPVIIAKRKGRIRPKRIA
jgi:O-antigen ligase